MPTADEIEAAATPKGGWTRKQLAAWGVSWPPPKGWKEALIDEDRGGEAGKILQAAPRGAGICLHCDLLVQEGSDAYRVDDGWSHAHCPPSKRPRKPRTPREPRERTNPRKAAARPKAGYVVRREDGKYVVRARAGGRCPICQRPIVREVDLIVRDGIGDWVHERCSP